MKGKKRERLDRLLFKKGLAESREKTKALILAGKVRVDGAMVDKAGKEVDEDAEIEVVGISPYVSRGGLKIEGALKAFSIDVSKKKAIDAGASTGGFTDCLLQHGADKVYAVDVGYGLIDWRLRNDSRVHLIEKKNIRHLEFSEIGETVDIVTLDLSFISLEKVIPGIRKFLRKDSIVLALVKPQFEVGRGEVGKRGIVRDGNKHIKVIERLTAFCESFDFKVMGTVESPIKGAKGNKEFWLYLRNL